MKSVVFVSAVLPWASASSGITDVFVIATDHDSCSHYGQGVSTSGKSDGNLNQGISHGEKLGLCFKTGSGTQITDLQLFKGDNENQWKAGLCRGDWEPVEHRGVATGDLNQGKHGKYIALCQQKKSGEAITDLQLRSDKSCPSGFQLVQSDNQDQNLNQHGHNDGKSNYLCAKKQSCDPIEKDIVSKWVGWKRVPEGGTYSWTKGITESHTKSWSNTVSDSISHGETQVAVNAKGSLSHMSSNTNTVSDVVSKTINIAYSLSLTESRTFSREGFAWKWVTEVPTTCGTKATIWSEEVVLSTDSKTFPCCYPRRTAVLDDASTCYHDDDILPKAESGCKSNDSRRRRRNTAQVEVVDENHESGVEEGDETEFTV